MTQVTVHEAKTNLSKLIALAEAGEEVVIARGKTPVVKIVPVDGPPQKRRLLGAFKGQFALSDAFFEPLPDDELARWSGEGD
jgi:prevent-host-death family protein